MRRALVFVAVLVILSSGHSAQAADGRQIFDFLAGQIDQEIEREQARQVQRQEQNRIRQQQREHTRAYNQLLPQWNACFDGDVAACDRAATSPILSFEDRQRLLDARASTIERVRQQTQERERLAAQQRQADEQAQREAEISRSFARCQSFDIGGCEVVLASAFANADQRVRVLGWKASAEEFEALRTACQGGSAGACDQALASPVADAAAQTDLRRWRAAITPADRLAAFLAAGWPASTGMPLFLFAVMTGLSAALAWVFFWKKPATAASGAIAQPPPIPAASRPRDPVSAFAALQLAHAYICEVQDNIKALPGNAAMVAHLLNELSLASKQLTLAEAADATATLNDDEHNTFSLADLKARALFFEAVCRSEADAKRAIRILHQAIALAPMLAPAHYWIGSLEAGLFHKPQAIAAFERAVALEPDNLDYKKDLGRAHNISASQIAFERAASGARLGVLTLKLTAVCFAVALIIVIAIQLADPATRIATIFVLFGVSAVIMGFIDTVKVMWADVTGRR